MRFTTRRKLEAARRVLAFFQQAPAPSGAAAEAVAELARVMETVRDILNRQLLARQGAICARHDRHAIRARMRPRLNALTLLSYAVARQRSMPALRLQTIRPTSGNDEFITRVRAALDQADDHVELMLRYGLPATLLDSLRADLALFEAAHQRVAGESTLASAATETLDSLAESALTQIQHLEALVRLDPSVSPGRLAEWREARALGWVGRTAEAA